MYQQLLKKEIYYVIKKYRMTYLVMLIDLYKVSEGCQVRSIQTKTLLSPLYPLTTQALICFQTALDNATSFSLWLIFTLTSTPLSAVFNNVGTMNHLPYRSTIKESFALETFVVGLMLTKGIISWLTASQTPLMQYLLYVTLPHIRPRMGHCFYVMHNGLTMVVQRQVRDC